MPKILKLFISSALATRVSSEIFTHSHSTHAVSYAHVRVIARGHTQLFFNRRKTDNAAHGFREIYNSPHALRETDLAWFDMKTFAYRRVWERQQQKHVVFRQSPW